jgi:hypothetical protein
MKVEEALTLVMENVQLEDDVLRVEGRIDSSAPATQAARLLTNCCAAGRCRRGSFGYC